jgi:hypothetical protein
MTRPDRAIGRAEDRHRISACSGRWEAAGRTTRTVGDRRVVILTGLAKVGSVLAGCLELDQERLAAGPAAVWSPLCGIEVLAQDGFPGFRPVRWIGRASHCSRSARTASSVRVMTENRSNRRDR